MRILVGLLFAATAAATPIRLGHQGRVLDATGVAVSGPHALTITLRDASDAVLHTENLGTVTLEDGYYSVILGTGDDLDDSVLDASAVYVAVAIDGTTLAGRSLLVASPYAARATVGERIDVLAVTGGTGCTDEGRIVYDTNIAGLRVCVGGSWQSVGVKTIVNTPSGRKWSDGSVASSCLEYLDPPPGHTYTGDIGDGDYRVDVDGDGSLPETTIECDMTGGGWMVFHHDRETEWRSVGVETPRGVSYTVTYDAPLSVITAARDGATSVEQFIKKRCNGSLIDNGTQYTAWLYPPGTVAPSSAWPNRAACDTNDAVWRESSGTVTNAAYLPVIQIDNGDTGDPGEDSYFTLGPFRAK